MTVKIWQSGWRVGWGLALLFLSAMLLLSQLSYHWEDIALFQMPPHAQALNIIGAAGAWTAFVAFMALGVGAYLLPAVLLSLALLMMFQREGRLWTKALWLLLLLLAGAMLVELEPAFWAATTAKLNIGSPGGSLGRLLAKDGLEPWLGPVGTAITGVAVLVLGVVMAAKIHPVILARQTGRGLAFLHGRWRAWQETRRDQRAQIEHEQRDLAKRRRRLEEALRDNERAGPQPALPLATVAPGDGHETAPSAAVIKAHHEAVALLAAAGEKTTEEPAPPARDKRKAKPAAEPQPVAVAPPLPVAQPGKFTLPGLDLLDPLPPEKERELPSDFAAGGVILKETLAEFGIDVEVTNVERGPVVTRYELLPPAGVRVEKIVGLSNNIALAMKAESVRIQAPIPGKGVVGIEVPNPKTTMVYMREILESHAWREGQAALPLVLGKDVSGREIIADLAAMPHLLIAGATGSGKTVCMNSILTGLLMARTPDQMKLMLIDPKIVEFAAYKDLPHLVVPVITDAKKVAIGLRWAITEMENRYKLFAKVRMRDIKGFNSRIIAQQPELFPALAAATEPPPPPAEVIPERLPYIVIVVDELADLMLVAQAEIEAYIARLTQMSRATGIHVIIATQRPSVNVITGTIKANIPARISFQVAQKNDSRIILDANGADKLLGKGDMLFLPPGTSKLIRAQGTLTKDDEIHRVVECYKAQGVPAYEAAIKDKIESRSSDLPDMEENDELIEQAIEVIRQSKRASTSSLQRRLRIGYTRAARIMDLLEERGLVGPAQGSDPREILIDLDGEIPHNASNTLD
ncbi:MAG: DNA translocase FtsK 4TM domain-containing protein [Kiritimatiellaeota bacterium]|nr:DNA translocase FtsK 4TM domain-containing protein [Kiritimatiellota bacterium]